MRIQQGLPFTQMEKPSGRTVNPMLIAEGGMDVESQSVNHDKVKSKYNYISLLVAGFLVVGMVFGYNFSGSITSTKSAADPLPRATFVHLFSWKWTDIEKECVNVLGPAGFSAVQVSPVSEHILHTKIKDVAPVGDYMPWWARYQPVSYKIESRSGSREEFVKMVKTCQSVGVDIIVDIVFNHMAAMDTGVGTAGSPYNAAELTYPDYGPEHFHYCEPPEIQGEDYSNNAWRVRNCQLVGLKDLDQANPHVRAKMIGFLQELVDIGVKGFRYDVAKHMEPVDLEYILSHVNGEVYHFGEVPSYGGEVVTFEEYTHIMDVTEFRYKQALSDVFMTPGRRLAEFQNLGSAWGFVQPTEAVVFVDNHDTQRSHDKRLVYRTGKVYELANVFLLAWPYGYPKLMSSYHFPETEFDQGPPSSPDGVTKSVYNEDGSDNCNDVDWVCEHRRLYMRAMVHWKNFVHSKSAYTVEHWWTNNFQAIAFSRTGPTGAAGFVVINKEEFAISNSWYTGLPDGKYCDVLSGEFNSGVCNGRTVQVTNGHVNVSVEGMTAFAIHGGARV